MAQRSETVHLNQKDIEEAIDQWLHNKYGPPKPDLQFRPGVGPWKIHIKREPHYDDPDTFAAEATRTVE